MLYLLMLVLTPPMNGPLMSPIREPQLPVTAATNEFLPPPKTPACLNDQQAQAALQQKANHEEMQCLPSLQAERRARNLDAGPPHP